MITLSEEQRQAVEKTKEPIRVADPKTQREYVLVQAEIFERMRRVMEAEEIDPSLFEFEETQQSS